MAFSDIFDNFTDFRDKFQSKKKKLVWLFQKQYFTFHKDKKNQISYVPTNTHHHCIYISHSASGVKLLETFLIMWQLRLAHYI